MSDTIKVMVDIQLNILRNTEFNFGKNIFWKIPMSKETQKLQHVIAENNLFRTPLPKQNEKATNTRKS